MDQSGINSVTIRDCVLLVLLTLAERLLPRPYTTNPTGPCLFSNQEVALEATVGGSRAHCGPSEYNPPIPDVLQPITLNHWNKMHKPEYYEL